MSDKKKLEYGRVTRISPGSRTDVLHAYIGEKIVVVTPLDAVVKVGDTIEYTVSVVGGFGWYVSTLIDKKIFVKAESYPDFQSFLMDNLPFPDQGYPEWIGWVNSFYFNPELLRRIALDWPKLKMRAMLGDKFSPMESLGMQVFLHLFEHYTGINLENPLEYEKFIKGK